MTAEMSSIDNDIAQLQAIKAGLEKDIQDVDRQLESLSTSAAIPSDRKRQQVNDARPGPSNAGPTAGVDYTEEFEWDGPLKKRMNEVFGIQDFRLCQEG